MLAIHNIAFQGRMWEEAFKDMKLPQAAFDKLAFSDGYAKVRTGSCGGAAADWAADLRVCLALWSLTDWADLRRRQQRWACQLLTTETRYACARCSAFCCLTATSSCLQAGLH